MASNSFATEVTGAPGAASTRPAVAPVVDRRQSYVEILKSTALIGGSSAMNIAVGVVRTKAMALFLGPSGVGLLGLYGSISDVVHSFAGLGIQGSGVRQIAAAVGTGDAEQIARASTVLKRVSVVLGLLGAALLVAFSRPIALLTFGSYEQAVGVALLSVAAFCRLLTAGQSALIQGMRRISDLARISVIGGGIGAAISIPMIYFLRERGIVPTITASAVLAVMTSWWYSRKIKVVTPSMTVSQVGQEAAELVRLGAAFMASGFLTMGAAYAIRIIVLRSSGFEAAGLYQAAWTLGGLYVGFILQAMGSDFYPRLTAVSRDNVESNRLVNEQAQISLLLAGPGVMATLTLAPLVISVFYTAEFHPAVSILRWICLGMTLRVVAWPMGFIVLAKGAQKIFFWTEVAATIVHVGLGWLLVSLIGLDGSGAAFFGLYAWHSVLIYFIVRRLSGFRWSAANVRLGMLFLPLTGLVFVGGYVFPAWLATTVGFMGVVISGVYSLRRLLDLVPIHSIPSPIRSGLTRMGWLPAVTAAPFQG